jgi:hypothetical protein
VERAIERANVSKGKLAPARGPHLTWRRGQDPLEGLTLAHRAAFSENGAPRDPHAPKALLASGDDRVLAKVASYLHREPVVSVATGQPIFREITLTFLSPGSRDAHL